MADTKAPAKAVEPISFIRAAQKLTRPMQGAVSGVLSSAVQDFGPIDIPAAGYLRYILLDFECSGGVLDADPATTFAADFPYNILRGVELADVNGQNIITPNIKGYDLAMLNAFGSYPYAMHPADAPDAVLTGANPRFQLAVPVQIDTDGAGCLPNLNAAEPYKLSLKLATLAEVFPVPPETAPIVTIRASVDDFSLPAEADGLGNPQAVMPPLSNPHSQTTQYVSKNVKTVATGSNTIQLSRMGNVIRNVIVVARDAAGVRTTDYPDDMALTLDLYQIAKETRATRRYKMRAQFRHYGIAIPNGVFVYSYTSDGPEGHESRQLWQPTAQPTNMELAGTFGATCKSLDIITNDVAPAQG